MYTHLEGTNIIVVHEAEGFAACNQWAWMHLQYVIDDSSTIATYYVKGLVLHFLVSLHITIN